MTNKNPDGETEGEGREKSGALQDRLYEPERPSVKESACGKCEKREGCLATGK